MDRVTVDIKDTIQTVYCIDMEDGEVVYKVVKQELDKGNAVELSFEGIEMVITAFLNSAIGRLFGEFEKDTVHRQVRAVNLHKDFVPMWDRVMRSAPIYYAHKDKVEHHTKKEMED